MPLFSGSYEGASFFELLRHDCPHLLPFQHLHHVPQLAAGEFRLMEAVPFATTVLALRFVDGVVMAGGMRMLRICHNWQRWQVRTNQWML